MSDGPRSIRQAREMLAATIVDEVLVQWDKKIDTTGWTDAQWNRMVEAAERQVLSMGRYL